MDRAPDVRGFVEPDGIRSAAEGLNSHFQVSAASGDKLEPSFLTRLFQSDLLKIKVYDVDIAIIALAANRTQVQQTAALCNLGTGSFLFFPSRKP